MANKGPTPGTSGSQPVASCSQIQQPASRCGKIFYPPSERHKDILHGLCEQRKQGEFCDIKIKLSTVKTVFAHKSLLVSASPFFMGMFSSSFMEATSESIDLSHMTEDSDVLEKVIDSFYGNSFEITPENVSEVMNLASMLLLDELKEMCCNVLNTMVSMKNTAEYLNLALEFDLSKLKEKLTPIIQARFHDYIMFQEEMPYLSIDTFSFILSIAPLEYVSRKAELLNVTFKWFSQCDTEERAKALVNILENMNSRIKVDSRVYREVENSVDSIVEHLGDANSDVSTETGEVLKKQFEALKPEDYAVNYVDEGEVVLEEEPEKRRLPSKPVPVYGPRTEKERYTEKEEKAYKDLHKEIETQRIHDFWNVKLLKNPKAEPEPGDPPKPDHIYIGRLVHAHETRNFRTKTDEEIEESSRLIDSVVVLSKQNSPGRSYDEMDIAVYIPRRKAWFHLGFLYASAVRRFGSCTTMSFSRHRRPSRFGFDDFDFDDDDDDDFRDYPFMAMRDMHDLDSEGRMMSMMMRDLPRHKKHRMMAMMRSKGERSPSELRRMMRDIDDDDMPPYIHEEFLRYLQKEQFRRRSGHERRRRGSYQPTRTSSVPDLTDSKWKCVYLRHVLYFCHENFCESVFSYNISTKAWEKTSFNVVSQSIRNEHIEVADGISLLVMGQTLYAVVRMIDLDVEPRFSFSSKEKYMKEQDLGIFHKFFRFDGRNGGWQMAFKSDSYNVTMMRKNQVDLQRVLREGIDLDSLVPEYCQAGIFKTSFFIEDDEKLTLFILQEEGTERGKKVFKVKHGQIVYLDLKKDDSIYGTKDAKFIKDPLPLFDDDLAILLNDNLQPVISRDVRLTGTKVFLGTPNMSWPEFTEGLAGDEQSSAIRTGDGRRAWVLRGTTDNRSEMVEVTISCDYETYRREPNYTFHPPPPFKHFTLATTAKMDKQLMPHLALPTKYLHC